MSDNYRFYAEKTRKRTRSGASVSSPREELDALLAVVQRCERMWALEDRIEGSIRRSPRA
jgi:hypothetical protein